MSIAEIIHSHAFVTFGIPLLVCLARVVDVTIGTLRIIFVAKGYRFLAPVLGFFEVLIWLAAITQVMQNLDSWVNFVAYAFGFSLGNYFGIYVENLLAIGNVVVRIITKRDSQKLVKVLRRLKYSVTVTNAEGNDGPVSVIFTITKRSNVSELIPVINHYNPRAVYSVEDVRHVKDENIMERSSKKAMFRKIYHKTKTK